MFPKFVPIINSEPYLLKSLMQFTLYVFFLPSMLKPIYLAPIKSP